MNSKNILKTVDFGGDRLNAIASKVIEAFDELDPKDRERALWMLQGYNLAQERQREKDDERL